MIDQEKLSQKAFLMGSYELLEEIKYWNDSINYWKQVSNYNPKLAEEAVTDNLETIKVFSKELCRKLDLDGQTS
jgi:uncharacterized protein Smg (DUF494 family)